MENDTPIETDDQSIKVWNVEQHPAPVASSDALRAAADWEKVGGGPRVVVSTAAFHARVRGSVPGLGGLKETKLFLPHPRVKVSIVGSLRDREVACSASDRQGSNFESCVWRTVSSQSSHHPQEVLLAQFSLYVHKGGLKPDSFHFFWEKVSEGILLDVAFFSSMAISRQKDGRSRDYTLLFSNSIKGSLLCTVI